MRSDIRRADRCVALLAVLAAAGCTVAGESGPTVEPTGAQKSAETKMLEAGATAVQRDAPPDSLDIYLVGFHPMKDDPSHQVEAHHFCRQVNEDFAQCVLYDGNTPDANLSGIEYIISESLFRRLPADEKKYWHPHNGEILSGQLVAPGLPKAAEKALMRSKMNSYGKTWHTWDARHARGEIVLPLGPPMLAWSFSRMGEAQPGLVENRDRRMGISSEELRQERTELRALAHPQEGVDMLNGRFQGPTQPIPGVIDPAGAGRK